LSTRYPREFLEVDYLLMRFKAVAKTKTDLWLEKKKWQLVKKNISNRRSSNELIEVEIIDENTNSEQKTRGKSNRRFNGMEDKYNNPSLIARPTKCSKLDVVKNSTVLAVVPNLHVKSVSRTYSQKLIRM
jgi:hypothetical protein